MSLPVVAHSLNPYCPASWIYHQIIHLRRHQPIVITKRTTKLDQFPVQPLYAQYDLPPWRRTLEKLARWRTGWFPQHRRALLEHKAVLLHSHYAQYGMMDWRLARELGIPHLTMFYGADIWLDSRQPGWLRRFHEFTAASQMFLVEGNAMRNKVLELGAPPDKVRIFHLGLDLSKIEFTPRRPDTSGEIRILMAGRCLEKKGHIYGLRAFAKLAPRYPQLHLDMIIGGDFSGSRRHKDDLAACIREHNLAERVTWSELLPYAEYLQRIRHAHIFLQPSVMASDGDAEGGFPVTILEMAASGMPVVATRHCDIPEAVLDGRSGLLASERDIDGLAERLELLIQQPELWEAYGRAGRQHVESEYNVLHQVEKLEDCYDELIAN